MIYGLDIHDKKAFEEDRIKIFQGSQDDEVLLRRIVGLSGGFDIVIDDGSHINTHVIKSFEILFPLLRDKGIYVVEDTQTSYLPAFGGSSQTLDASETTMGYFKRLVDGLNYEECTHPGYQPSYFDQHIVGIHFYHNLIVVLKGSNTKVA